jgi:hypothetical protein
MKINQYPSPEEVKKNKSWVQEEADRKKYDERLIAKLSSNLCNHERNQITDKKLLKERHNKNDVFFKAELIHQESYKEHEDAYYWYRCMSREDYLYIVNHSEVVITRPKDYGGIAPNFEYVTGYFKKSGGSHIVEFKMNMNGKAFLEAVHESEENKKGKKVTKQAPKAEGGGSIGLGPAGTYAGTAGELFNSMLKNREITWRLINFRVENPLPNDELFYVFNG